MSTRVAVDSDLAIGRDVSMRIGRLRGQVAVGATKSGASRVLSMSQSAWRRRASRASQSSEQATSSCPEATLPSRAGTGRVPRSSADLKAAIGAPGAAWRSSEAAPADDRARERRAVLVQVDIALVSVELDHPGVIPRPGKVQ